MREGVLEHNKRGRNIGTSCRSPPPNSNPAFAFAEPAVPTGAWAPEIPIFPNCAPQIPPVSARAEGSARPTGNPLMVIPSCLQMFNFLSPPSNFSNTPLPIPSWDTCAASSSWFSNELLCKHLPMKSSLPVVVYGHLAFTVPWGQRPLLDF